MRHGGGGTTRSGTWPDRGHGGGARPNWGLSGEPPLAGCRLGAKRRRVKGMTEGEMRARLD